VAYLLLKWLHILAAIVFLGMGAGTAWFKLWADRSGSLPVIVWAQRLVVKTDWIFTLPSGLVLMTTGYVLAWMAGWSLYSGWVLYGQALFTLAGLTWIPAARLQLRMRQAAEAALETGVLDPGFHRDHRTWLALGVPSFLAAVTATLIMVLKPV
jgi:uncharacterized membrane protein